MQHPPCQWIIEKKRDGNPLSEDEIRSFISGYTSGDIPDYQMSALAMAIYFQGMTSEETAVLTDAMMHSGSVIDSSAINLPTADKHSTGGIGDKVSLILAPLLASCSLAVPMISGRGLGITGGTLDKLESIPGYRCNLNQKEFLHVVNSCGCSISGQTENLVPADRKLYALRDVTGTVPSIPLITASILSKKLAEGVENLVLDVKTGNGAFMKELAQAQVLAKSMVRASSKMGKRVCALVTDMSQPLGRCVGNSLEVEEAVATLKGRGPADLTELSIALCTELLLMAKIAQSAEQAELVLKDKLNSGAALERFAQMVILHGGDPKQLYGLHRARLEREVRAEASGFVSEVNAEIIGKACILLGAGRRQTNDSIDHTVGVSRLAKCGQEVKRGGLLAILHANDESLLLEAETLLEQAIRISGTNPSISPLVIERISE